MRPESKYLKAYIEHTSDSDQKKKMTSDQNQKNTIMI